MIRSKVLYRSGQHRIQISEFPPTPLDECDEILEERALEIAKRKPFSYDQVEAVRSLRWSDSTIPCIVIDGLRRSRNRSIKLGIMQPGLIDRLKHMIGLPVIFRDPTRG